MPTVDLILKGGRIITAGGIHDACVAVDDGKIVAVVKEPLLPRGDIVLDVKEELILPGLIDPHVHFRVPGYPEKEDFDSGSKAALSGGITSVFDMPNTEPPVLNAETIREKIRYVGSQASVNYGLYAGAHLGNLEEMRGLAEAGAIAFKTFMSRGSPFSVEDDYALFKVLREAGRLRIPLCVHAEEGSIVEGLEAELKRRGRTDPQAHSESRHNLCEEIAVTKALALAKAAGVRLHIVHLSSKEGLRAVRQAKYAGQQVTVETCPQYLFLTHEAFKKHGAHAKMNPPLRGEEDLEALWEGVNSGVIDVIASDHAPHMKEEKDSASSIWETPPGMPGVETTLRLLLTKVNEGMLSLSRLVEAMSTRTAKIYGIYPVKGSLQVGCDADITIVDLKREGKIDSSKMFSKAASLSLFDGWPVKGSPTYTIVNGKIAMEDGEVVAEPGSGRLIVPATS